MVNAVVLLRVERPRVNEVAEELVALDGITEVYSVAGQYDLVVVLRTADNDRLAETVTAKVLQIDGITSSETLIAFRVFSRYDLDRIWSVGMDEPRE